MDEERCSADRNGQDASEKRGHPVSRKELLYYIVRQIVDHPDAVSINEVTRDDTLVLELSVDPSDMGKVIGRQGKIAKSIRSIVKAAAIRENIRVNVDIIG